MRRAYSHLHRRPLQGVSADGDQNGPVEYPPRYFYTIGAYRDDNEFYPLAGRIESVAIFDRTLSEDQLCTASTRIRQSFPDRSHSSRRGRLAHMQARQPAHRNHGRPTAISAAREVHYTADSLHGRHGRKRPDRIITTAARRRSA